MWWAMWSVCFHSYPTLPSQIRLNSKMDVWLSTVFACRARTPLRGTALCIYRLALFHRALNKQDRSLLPWRWRGESSLPVFPRLHPSFLLQSFLLRSIRDFSGHETITFPVTLLYFQMLSVKNINELDARAEAPALLVELRTAWIATTPGRNEERASTDAVLKMCNYTISIESWDLCNVWASPPGPQGCTGPEWWSNVLMLSLLALGFGRDVIWTVGFWMQFCPGLGKTGCRMTS